MKLIINGKEAQTADGATLAQLVAEKGLNPKTVIVEHNGAIIAREDWAGLALCSGDRLEIVAFVGGG